MSALYGKNRIEYIDIAKGICMFLVVYFHIKDNVYHLSMPFDGTIRMFHMPLFFILSGMFFNPDEMLKRFIVKKTDRLLFPFLFFYLTTSVLLPYFLQCIGYNLSIEGGVGLHSLYAFIWPEMFVNTPIWFLWSLFLLNILSYIIYQLAAMPKSNYTILFYTILSLIIGGLGYYLGLYNINLPMFLDTTFTCIPFFCFGFLVNHNMKKFLHDKINITTLLGLLIILMSITWLLSGGLNYRTNSFNISIIEAYIGGVAGSFSIICLSKMIEENKILSYIGRYSLVVLVTHYLVMDVICPIILKLNISEVISLFVSLTIVMGFTFIIVPIFKLLIPFAIGEKDLIKIK